MDLDHDIDDCPYPPGVACDHPWRPLVPRRIDRTIIEDGPFAQINRDVLAFHRREAEDRHGPSDFVAPRKIAGFVQMTREGLADLMTEVERRVFLGLSDPCPFPFFRLFRWSRRRAA